MTAVDSTIKQSRHDELHQGARYKDEVRRDATTRRLDDYETDNETDNERQEMRRSAQRCGAATRRDGTR